MTEERRREGDQMGHEFKRIEEELRMYKDNYE
jgi:hypothetical protein